MFRLAEIPDWAKLFWKPEECTVEPLAEPTDEGETHIVLDHNIQCTIGYGTLDECNFFLDMHGIGRID